MRRRRYEWLVLIITLALGGAAPGSAWAQKKGKPAAAKAADKPKAGLAGAKAAGAKAGAKGQKGAPPAAPAGADQDVQARVERTAGGGKVIKLTPIIVEGKVQKPLALVLARSSIPYEWEHLKHDFTPKIVDSVSKSPF
jgi:hypothetical protein